MEKVLRPRYRGDLVYPWDLLSAEIQKAHIKLRRVLDERIWELNKTGGSYTARLG